MLKHKFIFCILSYASLPLFILQGPEWSLVDIKGAKDAKNVISIFKGDRTNIFLGGTKQSGSEEFKWFDGSLVDQFHHWERDQPDSPNTQFCLRMDYDDDSNWRDMGCDENHSVQAVLCQRNGMKISL